jgi:hypothetical protein
MRGPSAISGQGFTEHFPKWQVILPQFPDDFLQFLPFSPACHFRRLSGP